MLLLTASPVVAQSLPPPARTVYKCQEGGRVVYSDSPCLGADRIDVTPTRGVSRLSGKERVGDQVRHEIFREQMADALKPVTGMNREQFNRTAERQPLSAGAKQECSNLDRELPTIEHAERQAMGDARTALQERLLRLRSRFRELRC